MFTDTDQPCFRQIRHFSAFWAFLSMTIKTAVIFVGLCVPFFLGTIWAIVDVAQRDFGTGGKKALWWVVASVPFVGFIVYLLFGFRKGKKTGLTI